MFCRLEIWGCERFCPFPLSPSRRTQRSLLSGNLAQSRALGDFEYKKNDSLSPQAQIITANPDVTCHEIKEDDEFLVLACDGDYVSLRPLITHFLTVIYDRRNLGLYAWIADRVKNNNYGYETPSAVICTKSAHGV